MNANMATSFSFAGCWIIASESEACKTNLVTWSLKLSPLCNKPNRWDLNRTLKLGLDGSTNLKDVKSSVVRILGFEMAFQTNQLLIYLVLGPPYHPTPFAKTITFLITRFIFLYLILERQSSVIYKPVGRVERYLQ